ncbi:3'-5' exonuclease [Tepidibacter formicigenes]|jgi:DNA polymerase III epsilon subunit-like protein|uniref:Exonuclease n=1 Tax=Tepidibacter formicigenes DSM 15518 TaxID=1123349 RepID=A0A1M6RK75_9FIRM|nr:3'-5' exonuclease [Tepidibacter formicigenes]SHK32842.1 Exonuclease [Tepidibacter formicigenes DSM 15518]
MNYIVFDLEWNSFKNTNGQAYYYKKFNERTKFFDEIIEIGAIKSNNKLEHIDSFRVYIKPTIYKKINPRIAELTGIVDEDLKYGFDFKKALKHFKKWLGKDYMLCSWGDTDIKVLKRNIEYYNPNYKVESLLLPYIDIQKYCCEVLGYDRRVSLNEVINEENIVASTDKFHQALDDTKLTVDIFREIFDKEKIRNYIINDADCLYDSVNLNITVDMIDRTRLRARCASCGKYSKRLKLSFDNKKRRVSILSYCSSCEIYTKQRIKIKRNLLGDLVYVSRKKIVELSG